MAIVTKNEFGTISVPEDLVSVIAGYAAVENYGIVGMPLCRPSFCRAAATASA